MEKLLGQDINPLKRSAFLKDNCDKVEAMGYNRKFSPEEIREMKDELAETSIKLNEIGIRKKETMASFKNEAQPFAQKQGKLLDFIKTKREYVTEDLFKFIDREERTVGYYNGNGELIDELTRPATGEELQGVLFERPQFGKTGTNN